MTDPEERVREEPLRETKEAVEVNVNDFTVTLSSVRVEPCSTSIRVATKSFSVVLGDNVTDSNVLSPLMSRAVSLSVDGSKVRMPLELVPVPVRETFVITRVVVTVVDVSITRVVSTSGSSVLRSSVRSVSVVTGISTVLPDSDCDWLCDSE